VHDHYRSVRESGERAGPWSIVDVSFGLARRKNSFSPLPQMLMGGNGLGEYHERGAPFMAQIHPDGHVLYYRSSWPYDILGLVNC
jgi:hypothetical protein